MKDLDYEFLILDTKSKIKQIFNSYDEKKILISDSGGKDSQVMTDILVKEIGKEKLTFVYFDTGIEYTATKQFLKEKIKEGYNIKIERGYKSVPYIVNKKGQPFLSKYVSDMLERLQNNNFDFIIDGNKDYLYLKEKYPKCLSGVRWWCNYYGSISVSYTHLTLPTKRIV